MEEFDIDRLKDYLNNNLSKEEKAALENRLKSDPEFKAEFEIHKSLLDGIEYHFDKQLKQSLKVREAKVKKRRLYQVMAIAASLSLIAIFSYQMFNLSRNDSEIFLKYYKPYYNVVDDPQRNTSIPPGDASVFQLYDKGEYNKAIAGLRSALAINPTNHEASFYLGLSHLAMDQPDSAVLYLNKGAQQGSAFSEPAQWYLGLAYLKSGKIEMAKKVFTAISNKPGGYRDRAEAILGEL